MELKLYVIPGSHPCACAEAAIRLKGLPYRRVDLPPVVHRLVAARGDFRHPRVPMLESAGRYICGSGRIMLELDRLAPEPPLFPAEPGRRAAVDEAERWGDSVLQPAARRIAWASFNRNRAAIPSYFEDARIPLPALLIRAATVPASQIARAANKAWAPRVRADLGELPNQLDHVDSLLAAGTLDEGRPSAADLQIGSSVRILLSFGDVRPLIEGRLSQRHAERLFPDYRGAVPAGTLPSDWLS
ncbi:MAG: glutathione S-transferase family protein [Thermoleophilaceae bacterium]